MKLFLFVITAAVLVSCVSVDVERRVKTASGAGKEEAPRIVAVPIDAPPDPVPEIIIEKPVYVPQKNTAPQAQGRAAVEQAAREGTILPEEYSHAAMIYDYHPDFVYEIYCRPLRITDLWLRPGEKATEAPFISDSERWMLGAGVSYEGAALVQHIYIKPTTGSLEATLIINTNERVYHIILRSYTTIHMPIVRWRYPGVLPQNYIQDPADASFPAAGTDGSLLADPRFLSFNYRFTYGLFKKPRWLPLLAYDDGKKTYITFPDEVLQTELPAVFENRADIVNYRVSRNVMIIDKLIEKVTVKIGTRQVLVEKKRGNK
ncbi:MAG: TrbG/VirB9 family P-type conjugative transfer protein [Treponema sp.]|jgi:type IV secretion system protein VirB9|nr:TrbG/VirB9 family P-type conjugative transfer protein [Treponema sp.]